MAGFTIIASASTTSDVLKSVSAAPVRPRILDVLADGSSGGSSGNAVLTGGNQLVVLIIGLIALGALGVAVLLVRQVLAADPGTPVMRRIAAAVQEGANAYLARQFRTLAVFAGEPSSC